LSGQGNRSAVTRDGQQNISPDREALVWTGTAGTDAEAQPADGGTPEAARPTGRARMRPPTPPGGDSYYGQPVINPPIWEEREIAGYLFLGGLSGASSILAAVAAATDRPRLAAGTQLTAAAAVTVSFGLLIKDLGRPARFINMLRVFKPTSPMSVGTWILSSYAPLLYASTASRLIGILPRTGRATGAGAAALGSLVSTYTAALIADTSVPAWHVGHRELPLLFAGSSASAAGGAGLLLAPRRENAPAQRMAVSGAVAELVATKLLERRAGMVGEAFHTGRAGRRLRLAEGLTLGGGLAAATLGRRSRLGAVLGGTALLAGSALTRFGLFAAGMESAREPRYTVEPQRDRLDRAAGGAAR
jgi:formate-dependent nitrite reductase membrane component NrfD